MTWLWLLGALALGVVLGFIAVLAIGTWADHREDSVEERLLTEAEAEEMMRPRGNVHVLKEDGDDKL